MSYPIIIISKLRVTGMAIYPFILIRNATDREYAVLIRHETIHLRQQLEMLILPFYITYLVNYLYNLSKFRNHNKAYKEIIFEREAYSNEHDPNYLFNRRFWGFRFYYT